MSGLARKLEKINDLVERLKDEADGGALLLVEGEKDVKSLKTIGIGSNVVAIRLHGKSLHEFVDEISSLNRKIILLMDFDRRGREMTKRLARPLIEIGAKVNLEYWRNLREILSGDVKDIEGLAAYLETLKKRAETSRLL